MDFKSEFDLLPPGTPLLFSDGTKVYENLAQKFVRHNRGFFILAPSGSGKTHFIKKQKEFNWIDGDDLWNTANAHPEGPWWLEDISVIDEIDQRCDVITVEAKKLGFWIIGASNYWLKPDAVVIPDWETHQKYIQEREKNNYDGGATSTDLERLKKSREWISRWTKEGVPIFKSVDEAAAYLMGNDKNN